MRKVDDFLNGITMYRLLYWGLAVLAGVSVIFAATDVLQFEPLHMLISLGVAVGVTTAASYLLNWLFGGTITQGSATISGLILFFLFTPGNEIDDWSIIAAAGVIAMASKYLLAWRKRHVFNPAAVGAVVVGWLGLQQATWWVASESLAIFVAILALLIVRKLHRFELFFSFVVVALVALMVSRVDETRSVVEVARDGLISFPILFLGGVMLTEPMTTPASRWWQIAYGAVVGILFGSGLSVAGIFMTPELALLLGNLVVFATFLKRRVSLRLASIKEVGPHLFEYRFTPDQHFSFKPGQYLEVTLDHVPWNSRGNRRSFSIASAPEEKEIILGVRHSDPPSTFKAKLATLKPGELVYAHQLLGGFTLPTDPQRKMVFITGGIGVTPFRSMLQHLVKSDQKRDIVFFYQVNDAREIVFKDVIKAALKHGVKPVFVLSAKKTPRDWKWETGFITQEMLQKHVKDYSERTFYISGPPGMVAAYKKMLNKAGVASANIVTDYFSGY